MRQALAESLLAEVMAWDNDDVARERPALQAMADYKYDEYEQYAAGSRFIERLARWLGRFDAASRPAAYAFVRERLVFISRAEMRHLVGSAYPDHVRPRLIKRAARDLGVAPHRLRHIVASEEFGRRHRGCLFLGLSDGARTDVLRRTTPVLSNEQVVADYQATKERGPGLLKDLAKELGAADATFTTLVLLDDFTASGISYARTENGQAQGKIAKVATSIAKTGLNGLVRVEDLEVKILLYVATEEALGRIQAEVVKIQAQVGGSWIVDAVYRLPRDIAIGPGMIPDIDQLIERHYDPSIETTHTMKGGKDVKYGFAGCGLTVVLTHNTPNNSLPLIWADTDEKALFPRVTRHRDDA